MPLPAPLFSSSDLPSVLTSLVPEQGRAAAKLLESLRFDSTVEDTSAEVFGVEPVGVRDALRSALREAA